jgi:hypothetical protein
VYVADPAKSFDGVPSFNVTVLPVTVQEPATQLFLVEVNNGAYIEVAFQEQTASAVIAPLEFVVNVFCPVPTGILWNPAPNGTCNASSEYSVHPTASVVQFE